MSTIRTLAFKTAVDQSGFESAIRSLSGRADDFGKQIGAKLASLKVAMPEVEAPQVNAPGEGAAGQADQLAASLLPLAGKIQSSITQAMAPLNAFAARFAGQFDQVGATIIQISKRIDDHFKFPVFQKGMEAIKGHARATFVDAEGSATRFGSTLDKVITGVQAASKLKSFLGSIGGLKANLGALKAPNITFGNSIRSVVNLKNVTNQAANTFKGLASEVALALGAFGLVFKAFGFLKDGISSASDLNETISKTDAVLGSASGSVKAFADDMASKFGLVKGETLDVASAIGGLGKGLGGLEGAGLAKFTTDLTKLAADLSSFKNISLAEAGKALQVGLSGEQSDQLKALGVVMTEDTLKSYAYANGIGKVGTELTEQQKVMARYKMLQAGLADASGDLEKTQSGAANQFRKLTGTITNLGTSIGTMLLPALTKGLGVLVRFGTQSVQAFEASKVALGAFVARVSDQLGSGLSTSLGFATSAFETWGGTIKVAFLTVTTSVEGIFATFRQIPAVIDATFGEGSARSIALFAAAIAAATVTVSALSMAGGIASAVFGTLTAPVVLVGAAVAGAAVAVNYFTGTFTSLQDVVDTAGFVMRNFGSIVEIAVLMAREKLDTLVATFKLIPENLARIGNYFKKNWVDLIAEGIRQVTANFVNFSKAIAKFAANPMGGFHFEWSGMLDMFKASAAKLPEMLKPELKGMGDEIKKAFDEIGKNEDAFKKKMAKPILALDGKAQVASASPSTVGGGSGAKAVARPEVSKELLSFAKEIVEKVKTPFEKYNDAATKVDDALKAGLITREQAGKGRVSAFNEHLSELARPKFAGAVEAGSKEGYSAILAATQGRGVDLKQVAERQLAAQLAGNATQAKIAAALAARPAEVKLAI